MSTRSSTLSKATTNTDLEDYDNESFEEESQNEDSEPDLSLSTLERLKDLQKAGSFSGNKTFTADRIREIERQNAILMNKILTYSRKPTRPKVNNFTNKYHVTSSAINRKKNQMKIDWENQILLKKIQTVKPSVKH